MNNRKKGFTLIELLVVVAVIGVLSSITVTNFSDALIRTKVARVKSDYKAMTTAIEMYRLDHHTVPPVQGPFEPSYYQRLSHLIYPVAYMNSLPTDPFQPMQSPYMFSEDEAHQYENRMYVYNRGDAENGGSVFSEENNLTFTWSLASVGPDRRLKYPYYYYPKGFRQPEWYEYNPSNGIISGGEIFQRSVNSLENKQ